jgi:hypothetical protein
LKAALCCFLLTPTSHASLDRSAFSLSHCPKNRSRRRPSETVWQFEQRFGLARDLLADWIDLQYLARRTRCITGLIYFPFLSLAVMILARNHLFDDFPISWTAVAAQVIAFAVIVGSVLSYRSAAENARKAARDRLQGSSQRRATRRRSASWSGY